MKHLFTFLIGCIASGLSAQSAEWNPDSDGDGLIGSYDLTVFLTVFGDSISPGGGNDEVWIDCTAEDYLVLSDTILPSAFEGQCESDFQGSSYYSNYLESQTDLEWWPWLDSLFLAGQSTLGGSITTVVTWPNTCNSVNQSTVREQTGLAASGTILLALPGYPDGSSFRLLSETWSDDVFFYNIGAEIVNSISMWSGGCSGSASNVMIPYSYGERNLVDLGGFEPQVLYSMTATLNNGVWMVD